MAVGLENNFRISINLERPFRPEDKQLGLKRCAITLIALGVIAIVTEAVIIALSMHGVLPSTGFLGWVDGLGSLRTLCIVSAGAGLIVLGGFLLLCRRKKMAHSVEKVEEQWLTQQQKAPEERVFQVADLPPIPGFQWAEPNKPRVLVISALQGGGHKTASESIQSALKTKYFVKTIFPTGDVPGSQWFDYCQKQGWHLAEKALVSAQKILESTGAFEEVHKQIKNEIFLFKPQLLISNQPISNVVIAHFANKYKIPFIVVPTDYKTDHFFYGFTGADDQFRVALPLEDAVEKERLKELYKFKNEHLRVTGYPIRPAFQEENDLNVPEVVSQLQNTYSIKENDRVVALSIGAQGGKELKNYCTQIMRTRFEDLGTIHVFALCGINEELNKKIRRLSEKTGTNVKIHPIGWSDQKTMAAFISLADVYITKPGGASTSEGLAMGTYLFFDQKSAYATPWEPANMKKTEELGAGEPIDEKTFSTRLKELLVEKKRPKIDFPGRHFGQNILALVDSYKLANESSE